MMGVSMLNLRDPVPILFAPPHHTVDGRNPAPPRIYKSL